MRISALRVAALVSRRGLVAASLFLTCLAPAFASGGAASTTTLAVTSRGSAATTVAQGAVVTLTATVTSGGTRVTPGQVKFCDAAAKYCEDNHLLGMAQLTSTGTATLKFVPGPGNNSYKAVFSGTTSVAGSASSIVALTVTATATGAPYPSSTTIQGSGSTSLNVSSTVGGSGVPAGTPAPTGTVSFLDMSNGGALLTTGTLVAGSASVAYGSSPVPAAGPSGGATISGDFNGDGYLDLAVSTSAGLTILLNNGSGTFTPVANGTALPETFQMVTGDFNGDGRLDIAYLSMANLESSTLVNVALGNGDGTFTAAAGPSPYSASGIEYIVAGDFNGDGMEDLAVSSYFGDSAGATVVLMGNGDGTFTAGTQTDICGELATGDFNGDGIADLAVYAFSAAGGLMDGSDPSLVYVALGGSSSLTFSQEIDTTSVAFYGYPASEFIVAADFNGDGVSDLFLGIGGTDPATGGEICGLALYRAIGNGTFSSGNSYPFGANEVDCFTGGYNSAVVGDFNGDGYLDVAVTQGNGSAPVDLYYAVGQPGFTGTGVSVGTSNAASVPTSGVFDASGVAGIAVLTAYNSPTDLFLLLPSTSTTVSSVTVNSFSLPEGTTHQVEASYGGDSNYSPSTSPNTVAITGKGIVTSMALTANPASSVVLGQAVTLTATLSPYEAQGVTTNGDTVQFTNTVSNQSSNATLSNGVATLTVTPSQAGTSLQYFRATYKGNTNFASSYMFIPYIVNPAPTTLTLTASPANLQVGGTLTLTATLSPYTAAGSSTNGEAVTFSSAGTVLGTGTLTNGVATLQITPAVAGSASYSANYAGDANFVASSGNLSYTVNPVPTTLALAVSPLGTTVGQSVTLTATLAPTTAAGVSSNGGTVTFFTGTTSLGTGTLTNGVATLATTALPAGADSLTAQYAGDSVLGASTSVPVSDTVLAIPSITFAVANKTYGVAPFTVAATSTSTGAITYSVVSGPATISGATVTVTGAGTVVLQASQAATSADIAGTQNASFVVAPASLAIAANSAARVYGAANPAFTGTVTGAVNGDTFTETFSTTATIASSVGSYPITPAVTGTNLADYVVLATPGTLTVTQAGTSTTLALTNGNKTFTATVTSLTSGNPTGTVTFYEGQTAVGTGTVSGGVATYTASSFPLGNVVVSAEYSGDANFTESQSPPILLLGLTLGADSLTVGQSGSVTDTVTVSVVPGYTGTVTFSCAGLPANASCSFAPASVAFSGASASAQATVTISTGVSGQARVEGLGDSAEVWAAGLLGPGLLGLAMAGRRKRLRAGLIVLVLCGLGLGLTACGGSGPVRTPEGQTAVQVVATGPEGLSQTSSVTLTVQ